MRLPLFVTGTVIAVGLLAVPVDAAPLSGGLSKAMLAQSTSADDALVTPVQYRRGYRGGYRRDRGDDGGAVAAGIIGGLVLGAIIANQAHQGRTVDYCVRRFRSYDPGSGTYLGNDGYRHRCP